jgi:hypothetical protein
MPGRILGTIYHIDECVARLGTPEASPDDGSHVRMVDSGHEDEGSPGTD